MSSLLYTVAWSTRLCQISTENSVSCFGLSMDDNMKADLCASTVANAYEAFPGIKGATIHSDRGSQYTSALYRAELKRCGITHREAYRVKYEQ